MKLEWEEHLEKGNPILFPNWYIHANEFTKERIPFDPMPFGFEKDVMPSKTNQPLHVRFKIVDHGWIRDMHTCPIIYSAWRLCYDLQYPDSYKAYTTVFCITEDRFEAAVYKAEDVLAQKMYLRSSDGISAQLGRHTDEELSKLIAALFDEWKEHIKNSQNIFYLKKTNNGNTMFIESRHFQSRYRSDRNPTLTKKLYKKWHDENDIWLAAIKKIEGTFAEAAPQPHVQLDNIVITEMSRALKKEEKLRFPEMTQTSKRQLHESVVEGACGKLFQVLASSEPERDENIEYLSSCHEKLGGRSYLHYVTQKNNCEMAAIMLHFGCEPSVVDSNNRVPFEYCKTTEMKEVFKDAREEDTNNARWEKSKVPVPKKVEPSSKKKSKTGVPTINEDKLHRKQKKENRQFTEDDYEDE